MGCLKLKFRNPFKRRQPAPPESRPETHNPVSSSDKKEIPDVAPGAALSNPPPTISDKPNPASGVNATPSTREQPAEEDTAGAVQIAHDQRQTASAPEPATPRITSVGSISSGSDLVSSKGSGHDPSKTVDRHNDNEQLPFSSTADSDDSQSEEPDDDMNNETRNAVNPPEVNSQNPFHPSEDDVEGQDGPGQGINGKDFAPKLFLRSPTEKTVLEDPNKANQNTLVQANTKVLLGIPKHGPQNFLKPSKRRPAPSFGSESMTENIFPATVKVTRRLRFDGVNGMFDDDTISGFKWYDTTSENYAALMPDKIIGKHKEANSELQNHDLYLRHGSCRVIGPRGLKYFPRYSKVDDREVLSHKVVQDICRFISIYPFWPFTVEVYWDYSSAQLEPVAGSSEKVPGDYADIIRHELRRKMENKNFRDQYFISRSDLNVFLDDHVSQKIINGDVSLKELSRAEKSNLCKKIQRLPAVKLLAICVYVGLKMKVLRHLIEKHGCTDKKLPEANIYCGDPCCLDRVDDRLVQESMHAFFARDIDSNQTLLELRASEVMPVHHTGHNNTSTVLGRGSFGCVYEVKIDFLHHSLSGDPDCCFALKEFYIGLKRGQEGFKREQAMLDVLADYAHPHIVAQYTSWSHLDKCYILYPRATYSLRSFLLERERPALEDPVILWFLDQLIGLADALKHVHHVKNPATRKQPYPTEDTMTGCHHDIKPENILVFEQDPGHEPVFKISDFGAGEFRQAPPPDASGTNEFMDLRGTVTYFGPDKEIDGIVSRPFDMWALGCVFLELVLWLFGFFDTDDGDGFPTKRADFSGADERNKEDKFWVKIGSEFVLKPPVLALLNDLEEKHCRGLRVFKRVVQVIRHLLIIKPKERLDVNQLLDSLKNIKKQARRDLRKRPNYYLQTYEKHHPGQRPSEPLPSERMGPLVSSPSTSRSPSISSQKRGGMNAEAYSDHINGTDTSTALLQQAGTSEVLRYEAEGEESGNELPSDVENPLNNILPEQLRVIGSMLDPADARLRVRTQDL